MKMKYFSAAVALMIALVLLGGCYGGMVLDAGVPENTNYEDMAIYKSLRGLVTEESTLEEMLAAFEEMSAIAVDSSTNMFLYEVYTFERDDENYLQCHIVRQVDEPGTSEYIQLHMDIIYLLDADMENLKACIWFDNDPEGFLKYIREGEIYRILKNKTILERHVSIDSTW